MKPEALKKKLDRIEESILSLYDDVADDWYNLDYIDAIIKVVNPFVDLQELLANTIEKQEVV